MLTLDLKSRFRNKAFIISFVGAIVLLIQQLGFKSVIPNNYADIVNSILSILTMLGIVVDTSTPGISDQVSASIATEDVNTKEEVKAEGSTTAINNTVAENSQSGSITDSSASSKIQVDVPQE